MGVAGASVALYAYLPGGGTQALAQIPGGTLDPTTVPKFVTPLLIPPAMPRADVICSRGEQIDYYEISVRQFQEQILPAGLPATTVWGYGPVGGGKKHGRKQADLHHAPSLTIEARYDRPVRVKWINELVDQCGNFLPHLLPVDPTLHWANPPQGTDPAVNGSGPRDSRPEFTSTPGPYTGPVPLVTHVHGAVGVGDESDGYTEAWYLPDADDIPAGFATVGTWYNFFKGKAAAKFDVTWRPGLAIFQYPNTDRASTNWYHDHTLGLTRLNVYAGPAGFYLLRGGPAGDDAVRDSRTGRRAVLPGPAPQENDPPNRRYREIPLAIQDRSFNADGSLFYPDSRAFSDGIVGPYIPDGPFSPIWNPEFFGNTIMVNGNTWPFLEVEQRRYRFRALNGCDARFLILDFNQIPGVEVWAIGNEGGFLAAPVNLTATNGNQLLMSPAERADLIVDFTNVPVGNHVLRNAGPDGPFPSAAVADPATTGQIMQVQVVPRVGPDHTTPPEFLQLPGITPLPAETLTRGLALVEQAATGFDASGDPVEGPVEVLLGTVAPDPNTGALVWTARGWAEPVTENPATGATEVWELYNTTVDAHPIHIHEVKFEVVNRQDIIADPATQTVQVVGSTQPPRSWETGFKDTVVALPGQVTRVKARFSTPGQFVWHCHIVEHEDNEMMRPYRIGPRQPGQPE
ncbi:multicopper oxidase family protein [Micromonospora eburnea]|uniref:multicopper oxidase family protein n=1 Tax=Micromonospora eburnea TaxID=227316 RepID=UPI001ABF2A99|nr:multicopper oxidase [Micromonospora eburnea]